MTHGHPQKLRHAKRVRYARMGHQIRMSRLIERVAERVVKERVARLLSQTASRMDLLTQAFQRASEATGFLIAAMNKGAA